MRNLAAHASVLPARDVAGREDARPEFGCRPGSADDYFLYFLSWTGIV